VSGLKHLTAAFSDVAPPAPARRPGARPPPPARAARREPGPSRLAYRLNRLWLTPFYRRLFRIGLPLLLVAAITGLWLSDETRRANLTGGVAAVVENIQSREAFMVRTMEIEGASPAVDRALRAMLPVTLPASSFDIELRDLRQAVERLDAIEKVEFRIRPGGILSAGEEGIRVCTGKDLIRITRIKPDNGRNMTAGEFVRGHPLPPDARFT